MTAPERETSQREAEWRQHLRGARAGAPEAAGTAALVPTSGGGPAGSGRDLDPVGLRFPVRLGVRLDAKPVRLFLWFHHDRLNGS